MSSIADGFVSSVFQPRDTLLLCENRVIPQRGVLPHLLVRSLRVPCKLSPSASSHTTDATFKDNLSAFINHVVDELLKHDPENEPSRYQYTKTLCSLFEGTEVGHWGRVGYYLFPRGAITEDEIEFHIFVAAIHVGQTDIFRHLPAEHRINMRRVKSNLFGHPLESAVEKANYDLVKLLLERGADPTLALKEAIFQRNHAIAFLSLRPEYGLPYEPGRPFEDALHGAIWCELYDVFYYILERIKDRLPEFKDFIRSGFSTACQRGMFDVVQLLFDNGADVNARRVPGDGSCPNPISQASWAGHEHIVRFLLSKGAIPSGSANPSDPECRQSMCAVAWGGHAGIAKLLLDAGAQVGGWYKVFEILAYTPTSVEVARLLFDRGLFNHGDFSTRESGVCSLMAISCIFNNPGFARLLVEHGVPLEDDTGFYARHDYPPPVVIAAASRKSRVKKVLLALGATDVDPLDSIWRENFLSGEYPMEPNSYYPCPMPMSVT